MTRKPVFLFKSVKETDAPDRYEQVMIANGIPFALIPVLSFGFVNRGELMTLLSQPDQFSSIILSSPRAVEAVVSAKKEMKNSRDIAALQCFVVGQATHDAAVEAGFQPEGGDSGNGDFLTEYIAKHVKDLSKPLLFPCSNIRRDTIPNTLRCKGLVITELVVYETHPNEYLKECVEKAVEVEGQPDFAVFFSPSGFNHVYDLTSQLSFSLNKTKLIALGPTTAAAIKDRGCELYATAEKPDPDSILPLIQQIH